MSSPPQLAVRLRERLAASGKSPRAVSLEIGANQGYVRDLLDPEKTGSPGGMRLARLAQALGTTTGYLIGDDTNPEQPASEVAFRELPQAWRGKNEGGIKLLGTGYCADLRVESEGGQVVVEQLQLEVDHVVRIIERPLALSGAKDAYAIYFHGSSMEPRYYQGEVAIVDPRRPAGPGDFVVVQLNNGASDEVITVLVKHLVRLTANYVELAQFNPALAFRLPRSQVSRIHRIVNPTEMLGG